jgi:hypothetical protein
MVLACQQMRRKIERWRFEYKWEWTWINNHVAVSQVWPTRTYRHSDCDGCAKLGPRQLNFLSSYAWFPFVSCSESSQVNVCCIISSLVFDKYTIVILSSCFVQVNKLKWPENSVTEIAWVEEPGHISSKLTKLLACGARILDRVGIPSSNSNEQ